MSFPLAMRPCSTDVLPAGHARMRPCGTHAPSFPLALRPCGTRVSSFPLAMRPCGTCVQVSRQRTSPAFQRAELKPSHRSPPQYSLLVVVGGLRLSGLRLGAASHPASASAPALRRRLREMRFRDRFLTRPSASRPSQPHRSRRRRPPSSVCTRATSSKSARSAPSSARQARAPTWQMVAPR